MIENDGGKTGTDHIILRGFIWQAKLFELYSVGDSNLQKGFKVESNINRYVFSKAFTNILYLVFYNCQNIINWKDLLKTQNRSITNLELAQETIQKASCKGGKEKL